MGHKCFISFKTEDDIYKKYIQDKLNIDMIDKSLDEAIDSDDEDYIMQKIRTDYLSESTVTIHLIGQYSSEALGWKEQKYIKRELQASLYNGKSNPKNGILGLVLPTVENLVFTGSFYCSTCGGSHTHINVRDTTISEFSYNYFLPNENKCAWTEEDRYCVLVKWYDFVADAEKYIDMAYDKRTQPISDKTKVRP